MTWAFPVYVMLLFLLSRTHSGDSRGDREGSEFTHSNTHTFYHFSGTLARMTKGLETEEGRGG